MTDITKDLASLRQMVGVGSKAKEALDRIDNELTKRNMMINGAASLISHLSGRLYRLEPIDDETSDMLERFAISFTAHSVAFEAIIQKNRSITIFDKNGEDE